MGTTDIPFLKGCPCMEGGWAAKAGSAPRMGFMFFGPSPGGSGSPWEAPKAIRRGVGVFRALPEAPGTHHEPNRQNFFVFVFVLLPLPRCLRATKPTKL